MHDKHVIVCLIYVITIAIFQGHVYSSPANGEWYKCDTNGKYYYFGVKRLTLDNTWKFCKNLFDDTRVANFGRTPVEFSNQCNFHVRQKMPYWIECSYGQPQLQCTTLYNDGHHVETKRSSCFSLAYPVCETSKIPITTKIPPTTRKAAMFSILRKTTLKVKTKPVIVTKTTTSIPPTNKTISVTAMTNSTSVPPTNKTISVTAMTSVPPSNETISVTSMTNTTSVPISKNTTLVQTTQMTTAVLVMTMNVSETTTKKILDQTTKHLYVSKVFSTVQMPFPILCALFQGWLNIQQHSYCVTKTLYTSSDASIACRRVNGTLADIHAVWPILNPIIVGLNLSGRTNLRIWMKETKQGQHQLLQINGRSDFSFVTDSMTSKHPAFCERETNTHKATSVIPRLSTAFNTSPTQLKPDSTNDLLSLEASSPYSTRTTGVMSNASKLTRNPFLLFGSSSKSTVPITTSGMNGNPWIQIDAYEYFVNFDIRNHASALEYCSRTARASLISFLSPMHYFQVFSKLNISDGSFWIGSRSNGVAKVGGECLIYHSYTTTLSLTSCSKETFSICSRYRNNVTELLENATFRNMLREMTVNKSDTIVNKRKVISANNDHRWTVKAIGSVSLIVIILTIILPLLTDLDLDT